MIQGFRSFCSVGLKLQSQMSTRTMSAFSKTLAKEKRNELFNKEQEKQQLVVGRIEKIEVKYLSPVDEVTLIMNRNISTPHDCAKHISEGVASVSAIALVNNTLWDMHKPLPENCTLKLLTMKNPEKIAVNSAFWRTCSFILGAVIDTAFKDDFKVYLHSFTWPNIKSGSFVHDAYIDLPNWKPTDAELRALSATFVKLIKKELPVERLQVTEKLALKMFEDNPFKTKQIPDIAKNNDDLVTLYRIDDHIDISKGPMLGNTSLIGRCTLSAVHKIQFEDSREDLYRFQGVAIPTGILLNHFAYSILEERAKKLNNTTWMPMRLTDDYDYNVAVAAKN